MKKLLALVASFSLAISTLAFSLTAYAATPELIKNGGFEEPEVTSSEHWQIFSDSEISPWVAVGTPDPGDKEGLEFQKNGISLGSTAFEGTQYVELDSYYPVTLSQPIDACQSGGYLVSFNYAPRPGQAENKLLVKLDNTTVLDASLASTVPFTWRSYTGEVVGSSSGQVIISFQETGTNDQLGMFLDNVSVRCKINRHAAILSPIADEVITDGSLELDAFLVDDDYDAVQWAVRKGTCKVATNTVMGNVDTYHDTFSWIVDPDDANKYLFTAEGDVSGWADGSYCFVFNPTEDAGETDIRLTQTFTIDNDIDNDGIINKDDKCSGTAADKITEEQGVNRWTWNGSSWLTVLPKSKTVLTPSNRFTMTATSGCSCTQILDKLKAAGYGEFGGHYKFGCSQSVMEEWIAGYYQII